MRKEARLLLEKAIDSLILSIEHFNRPWDKGRKETVLILMDHSFEMLLKASIIQRGGRIRKPKEKQTIGFDSCVHKSLRDDKGGFINEEEALTLQVINSLRDAAQHYLLDISENHLYIHIQSGLTLFREILKRVFNLDLNKEMPERVLPVSTTPPTDFSLLFDNEVKEVRKLLSPHSRRRAEAAAKLRSLAIMEGAIQGENVQPGDNDLKRIMEQIRTGASWDLIFPGVASINLVTEGYGPEISLKITKKEGIPIQVVPEGTHGGSIVAIRRVNELDYYSLNCTKLSKKVGLTIPKTTAVIWYGKIKGDSEYHKKIQIGKAKFDCYSPKSITKIRDILAETSIEDIWDNYKHRGGDK